VSAFLCLFIIDDQIVIIFCDIQLQWPSCKLFYLGFFQFLPTCTASWPILLNPWLLVDYAHHRFNGSHGSAPSTHRHCWLLPSEVEFTSLYLSTLVNLISVSSNLFVILAPWMVFNIHYMLLTHYGLCRLEKILMVIWILILRTLSAFIRSTLWFRYAWALENCRLQ